MPEPPRRHSLADHAFGALAGHAHDGGEDHDHDHDEDPRHELIEAGSHALEAAPFVSIGIDVGSASTQVVFSRLAMRGPGEPASLRRLLKSRETLFVSPVSLTPWRGEEIDVPALRAIVDDAFGASGVSPDDVETGAAILTGDAAASDNARRILDALAEDVGELVSAVAGHHMEALLAAYGSGAVRRSMESRGRVLLVDVGGGTSKFALIEEGRVRETAAVRIGARLAVFDEDLRIRRLKPEAAVFARRAGFVWEEGAKVEMREIDEVADLMADALLAALGARLAATPADLWGTEPLAPLDDDVGLMFSGGVAEYVYDRESRFFGDLGLSLGRALRGRIESGALRWPLLPPGEGLRATALGASEHSAQISGETSFISSPAHLLPRRNLPVVAPTYSFRSKIEAEALAQSILEGRRQFDLDGMDREFLIALRWRGDADYERLSACAKAITLGLADIVEAGTPIFLALEGDVALNLAHVLRDEFGVANDILALDGLVLRDFDFVDFGRLRLPSNTVPVTVKSLLFTIDQKRR